MFSFIPVRGVCLLSGFTTGSSIPSADVNTQSDSPSSCASNHESRKPHVYLTHQVQYQTLCFSAVQSDVSYGVTVIQSYQSTPIPILWSSSPASLPLNPQALIPAQGRGRRGGEQLNEDEDECVCECVSECVCEGKTLECSFLTPPLSLCPS